MNTHSYGLGIDNYGPYLVVGLIAVLLVVVIFNIFRQGGLKSAIFGAPVKRKVGAVTGAGLKMVGVSIKIYSLGGKEPEKAIGLEVISTSFGSYEMTPVTFSVAEATRFAALLQSAVSAANAT